MAFTLTDLALPAQAKNARRFQSPDARHQASQLSIIEPGAMEAAEETEQAHIPDARGCVADVAYARDGRPGTLTNPFGKIDGARFTDFDPETRMVTLRIDDSHVPSFWTEVRFTLDKLEEFCGRQEASM